MSEWGSDEWRDLSRRFDFLMLMFFLLAALLVTSQWYGRACFWAISASVFGLAGELARQHANRLETTRARDEAE